ncbi:hydrogenase-4 component E [bacterium BMS3Abin07]|nr:hydrogenase-4 component E [bacterium BMS3Abin07]GBE00639.1 hydrogenase-4 component E [bacterium BMS3Abin08]GBE31440.1 hydrogenase-4 component E [bacterium BMS3Bbin05]
MTISSLTQLNALTGGLFLLSTFGIIAMRQILGCLKMFVLQSVFLAASALLLGYLHLSIHLFAVAAITLMVKPVLIPYLLRRTVGNEVTARREISQLINIPTSLLIAVGLTIISYFVAKPLLSGAVGTTTGVNLPIGMACLLLGAYTVTVRREALPQIIGILTMENGAFFAGISIAPDLPLIAELSAAFDVLIIALVMGILTRKIHERIGSTTVSDLKTLKEV